MLQINLLSLGQSLYTAGAGLRLKCELRMIGEVDAFYWVDWKWLDQFLIFV